MNESQHDDNIGEVVEQAVRRVFSEYFELFGHDVNTPQGRASLREDFTWVRQARQGTNFVRKTTVGAVVATFITGAAFGLWSMVLWIAGLGKGQ